ncbi:MULTISPECIES: hypothetical protein [Pedobacter]|uniref:hypothetical protein n=1 Tax=Pedobacter TaxID=84567 RepID=UPI00120F8555|nr:MULTISPECIES: hypothetical protein [Pedobacter]RZL29972.1 MAG: hypothetical protein EOO96_19100 [Pedobacter sp.]
MGKLFITLAFIFISATAWPQVTNALNSSLKNKVLEQLGLKPEEINEELYVEKVLPYAKTQTAIVICKNRKSELDKNDDSSFELDAYIIIANNITGKILYKYFEESEWISDAIMLTGITIDTGIFTLNNETRAFGVQTSYANGSQPNPHHHTDLSLFVQSNKTLKKVLNNYTTQTFGGEWDTRCAGEFEDVTSTIIIDRRSKFKNFNSLIIKDKITKIRNTFVNEDCVEKKTFTHRTNKLKYNGMEYTK